MDYEVDLGLLGTVEDSFEPFPGVVRKHPRVVMDVRERAELHLTAAGTRRRAGLAGRPARKQRCRARAKERPTPYS